MITNAGILCFTIGAFVDWPVFNGNPFVPFILLLSAMFFLRQLIKDVLPSLPEKYKMILDRHDWLVNKKLKGELKKEKIYEPTSQGINFNIEGIKR